MKMQSPILTLVAATAFLFTACEKDNVAVVPDRAAISASNSQVVASDISPAFGATEVDTVKIDLVFFLDMKYVDCPPEQPIAGNTPEIGSASDMQVEIKCLADIIGTGTGQGYDHDLGRATAGIDFNYNLETNQLCGRVRLDFIPEGDYLVVNFCGTPEANMPLELTVTRAFKFDGDGRFEHAEFEGTISLGSAEDILNETSTEVISNTSLTGTLSNLTL